MKNKNNVTLGPLEAQKLLTGLSVEQRLEVLKKLTDAERLEHLMELSEADRAELQDM